MSFVQEGNVEYFQPADDSAVRTVHLRYDQLEKDEDLSDSIAKAYGFDGLGILVVTGVPNFEKLRSDLLPLAHKFANLPDEVKQKTEHKESFYSFGWSHGKEILEGKPDYSKGSYYNNPVYNRPIDDEELIKKYPSFCHPNIWPTEDLPELEGAFLAAGKTVVATGELVAKQCDRYVAKHESKYPSNRLSQIIHSSRTAKARLLHYFPSGPSGEEDKWCGWHNDHGSLTGLFPAMYLNPEGQQVPSPDSQAGLYIRCRAGNVVKVAMPPNGLAFQIGETAQIHSGGLLQATPHCVRGPKSSAGEGISRQTFAVFMEPEWDEAMDAPADTPTEKVVKSTSAEYLPPGVPQLATRWKPSMTFGEFTDATLKSYY